MQTAIWQLRFETKHNPVKKIFLKNSSKPIEEDIKSVSSDSLKDYEEDLTDEEDEKVD